jgi:hypothetical protein
MNDDDFYLLIEGDTSGPYTLEKLHELWEEQRIDLKTLYVQPGMRQCRPIDTIVHRVIGFGQVAEAPEAVAEAAPPRASLVPFWWAGLIVITLIAAWTMSSVSSARKAALREPLNAGVELGLADLKIANQNRFEWREIEVFLNEGPPQGYSARIPQLMPGDVTAIPLVNFMTKEGVRFEPWRMDVGRVWVGQGPKDYTNYVVQPAP